MPSHSFPLRASITRVIETLIAKPRLKGTPVTMCPAPAVRDPTILARPRFLSTKLNSSAAEPVPWLVSTKSGTSGRRGPGTSAKLSRTIGSPSRRLIRMVGTGSEPRKWLKTRWLISPLPPPLRRTSMISASVRERKRSASTTASR
ncbi:MAG: hypothetical protein R2909_15315 [Gemmatimonadales bacterium]